MGKYFETSTNGVNTSSKIMGNITNAHVKTEPGSIKVPNDISTPNISRQPTTYVAPSNGRSKIVETNPKFQEIAADMMISPAKKKLEPLPNIEMTYVDEDGNEHTTGTRDSLKKELLPNVEMTYVDEDGNEHTTGTRDSLKKVLPVNIQKGYIDEDGNKYYYVKDGSDGHWEDADGNIIEDPSDLSGEESTNTDNQDNDAQSPSNEESNNEKERTPDSNDQNDSKNTASKTSTQINNTSVRKGTNSVIIKLDAGELNTRKTGLKTATNELIKAWNDIKSNQIPAIEQSWIGTDSKAYTNKVTAQDPKLQAAFQALELLTNTFDKASNELQQTQSEVVKGINQS